MFQEFQGVAGLPGDASLESDTTNLPERTVEVLAACHALVFVENKLVCFSYLALVCHYI